MWSWAIRTHLEVPLNPDVTCSSTADPAVGATCALNTAMNALVPGAVRKGDRAVWELGTIEVYDGGPDGVGATADNTLFARQGVFIPWSRGLESAVRAPFVREMHYVRS